MTAIIFWLVMGVVAITAIVTGANSQRKKIELEMRSKGIGIEPEELKLLLSENQELKERIGNLESIITSIDEEVLLLNAAIETDSKDQVKRLAERLNRTKNS